MTSARRRAPAPALALTLALALAATMLAGVPASTADAPASASSPLTAAQRPNILLITSDDQAASDMRWMPRTTRLIGASGVRFSSAIAPNPLCCPARATLLTGQYSHNHGVRGNGRRHGGYAALHNGSTVATWLRAAGYQNAFVGKYLNGYNSPTPREPGWDSFDAMVGRIYQGYGTTFSQNGTPSAHPDAHSNDLVGAKTRHLISQYAGDDRPFFIWSSYVAPHGKCTPTNRNCSAPPTPARRHAGSLAGVRAPQLAKRSFNERDVRDKPPAVRRKKPVSRAAVQRLFTQRIRSMASMDQSIAATIAALASTGQLGNTLIVYTTDNGYQLGEHRLVGKAMPYEESFRVPLLMRGPGVPRGVVRNGSVSHVDIVATIARIAGARPGLPLDGRDLMPLARKGGWNPYTHAIGTRHGGGENWTWRGVRTQRYTWVRWYNGFVELYDRTRDASQMRNVAEHPRYRNVRKALVRRHRELKACDGSECRRSFGALPKPGNSHN